MSTWQINLRYHLLDGTLRALRARNFRLFFLGQSVSLVGTWMTRVALGWLVYRLTDSALLLGVVGFAGQIPAFLLAPVAGWLADRVSRWRILVTTQTLAMLQSFALAALTLSGTVHIHHLIALAAFQGVIDAFDMTTRQSFVVEMVERREDLPNAIALNSMSFNGARMVGPSVAGILIGIWGEGACFLIDGFSYLAVLVSLFRMIVPTFVPRPGAPTLWRGVSEGFNYAFRSRSIRSVLLSITLLGMVGMSYSVLMPVIARDVLGGGARTMGFLLSAVGIGALSGGIYLASTRSMSRLGRRISFAAFAAGFWLVGIGLSHTIWFSLGLMYLIGLCFMVQMASCNTFLQTTVPDDKRGRVMSLYTMSFMGTAPLGSLLTGKIADHLGASGTCLLGGAIYIFFSLILAWEFHRGARAEQLQPSS
jgi:MFS family permease